MASNSFNMNNLWRQFSLTGNETLSISAYNGSASLTMFRKGTDNRKPAIKFTLSRAMQLAMADRLEALLDAPPGTRSPIVQQRFSKENRTYEIDTQFVFVKDDKKCYSIEVSNKYVPTPVKFGIRCPSTFSFGSDALTDEQKSYYGMQELIDILRHQLPQACLLTRDSDPNTHARKGGSGNGNGGGNYQRRNNQQNSNYSNSNSQGSRDPFENMSVEEDSVFG